MICFVNYFVSQHATTAGSQLITSKQGIPNPGGITLGGCDLIERRGRTNCIKINKQIETEIGQKKKETELMGRGLKV